MADLSEFDKAHGRVHEGHLMAVDRVLSKLPDKRADKLRAALSALDDDGTFIYGHTLIARVVEGWGVPCRDEAVRRWRVKHVKRG